jgi:excisionase family DNA binding protein
MDGEFVTVRAAADALSVSESTVRRLFDEGKLRGMRTPGGHRRIDIWSLREMRRSVDPGTTFDHSRRIP